MSTILIIDDNESYRASLVEILALELHTILYQVGLKESSKIIPFLRYTAKFTRLLFAQLVLEAENGQIGLLMIRQDTPDIIVCDMDMPIINGFEVLRTAKADPIYARIPFVMLTGHRGEQALKASRELGVEAYLSKPVAVTEFLSTIGHFLKDKDPCFIIVSRQNATVRSLGKCAVAFGTEKT